MKVTDFIKQIKTAGESAKCFFIEKQVFYDVEGADADSVILPDVYLNEEDARKAISNLLSTLKAEFGEYLSINLISGLFSPVDFEGVDENDADLFSIADENGTRDDVEYFYVYYEYKSLAGAILVFWSWQTHVGYCRKFEEVRYAYSDEDEKMCIKEDMVYSTQCDVLCEASELVGLSREEVRNLVGQKLSEKHWKWENDACKIFNEYISL